MARLALQFTPKRRSERARRFWYGVAVGKTAVFRVESTHAAIA